MPRVIEFVSDWLTYGTKSRTDQVTRLLLVILAAFGAVLLLSGWHLFPQAMIFDAQSIRSRVAVGDYAYVMAGLCGIWAAGYVAIIAILLSTADIRSQENKHVRSAAPGLLIGLVAFGVASVMFASVYGVAKQPTTQMLSDTLWELASAAVVNLVSGAFLLLVTIAIAADLRLGDGTARNIMRALTLPFVSGFVILAVHLALMMPGHEVRVVGAALFGLTAQAFFPHGPIIKRRGLQEYKRLVMRLGAYGTGCFSGLVVSSAAVLFFALVSGSNTTIAFKWSRAALFITTGSWYFFFQVWCEGWRQLDWRPEGAIGS